jgi:hypothetical protein
MPAKARIQLRREIDLVPPIETAMTARDLELQSDAHIVDERHPYLEDNTRLRRSRFHRHQARVLHQISPAPNEMNRPEARQGAPCCQLG